MLSQAENKQSESTRATVEREAEIWRPREKAEEAETWRPRQKAGTKRLKPCSRKKTLVQFYPEISREKRGRNMEATREG